MGRERLHHRSQRLLMQKFAWVPRGFAGRQKTKSKRFDAQDERARIGVTLETFRNSRTSLKPEVGAEGSAMEVSFDQQHPALSLLGQDERKIERNRGLSIVRLRAGDQQSLQLLFVPDLVQTQAEK